MDAMMEEVCGCLAAAFSGGSGQHAALSRLGQLQQSTDFFMAHAGVTSFTHAKDYFDPQIFLGAVGWPARLPDHVTLTPLIRMRQAFDLYACVRPARTFPGVTGPLRRTDPIDVVVVRENSEGEYIDNGGIVAAGTPGEVAVQTAIHTRRGVERILRFAFDLARTRNEEIGFIFQSFNLLTRATAVHA